MSLQRERESGDGKKRGASACLSKHPNLSSSLASPAFRFTTHTHTHTRIHTHAHTHTHSDLLLRSVNVGVLGALLTIGASPRPSGLGVRDFKGQKSLALCPSTPNCVSTAEEANDPKHYIPQWSYGKKSKADAMADLVAAVSQAKVEGFTPTLITQEGDYLYAEFESGLFGFVDDAEFLLKDNGECEYRSASRIGESDGDANRKRIRALRKFLEPRGWKSIGFV